MIISIKNFNIFYESKSLLNVPSLIKIGFRELNIHTTDENWNASFNSGNSYHFREINLSGFSITLNLNKQAREGQSPHSAHHNKHRATFTADPGHRHHTINDRRDSIVKQQVDSEMDEEIFKTLRDHDTYLLFPLDCVVRIKTQLDLSKDFSEVPIRTMNLDIKDPIIFVINTDHVRYLTSLNDHLNLMKLIQKNIHLRPSVQPQSSPKQWWIYAIKSVTEERKRGGAILKNSTKHLLNMRKYIDLFKRKQGIIHVPWLPRITPEEGETLNKLEEEIPLQNLLEYREWAFIEIRVEAKRFFASNKDVQGMKPLIDIWSNAINNEEAFTSAKEKTAETIRLTPIEQADLYEILSQDKAKVLESYLKGENNDPKDVMLNLKLSVRSLYFLVAESKEESNKINVDSKKLSFHPETRSWHTRNPTPPTETLDAFKSNPSLNEATKKLVLRKEPSRRKEKTEEDSFFTAPNEEEKSERFMEHNSSKKDSFIEMDSFFEHLKDFEEGGKGHFKIDYIEPQKEKEGKHEFTLAEGRRELSDWWNQNLILLIEILDISVGLLNYRNGGIRTEKTLICKSLMVTTALNLPKAIETRNMIKGLNDFCLKYETLMNRILAYDFTFAIPDAEGTANPLIKYLKEKGCENIATFLETYNKDKKSTGLIISKIDDYKPFFQRSGPMSLKLSEANIISFNTYIAYGNISKETKENIINEAYKSVEAHVNQNILPLFLYSYGVLVIPLMFQAEQITTDNPEMMFPSSEIDQKEIKSFFGRLRRFPTKIRNINLAKFLKKKTVVKPVAPTEKESGMLELKFSIEGTQSQFKIQRVDTTFKKKKKKEEEAVDSDDKEREFVEFNFQPLKIFLSVESMRPLVQFVSSLLEEPESVRLKNEEYHSKENISVDEFQSLMNCINHNPNEPLLPRFQDLPNMDATLSMLQIEVTNFNSHYLNERKLTFTINNLKASLLPPQKTPRTLAPNAEIVKLEKENMTTSFKIEKLELAEWYQINGEETVNVVLQTKIVANIYDCIYDNHPLYTDHKIHILIPFVRVQLDDNQIMITELLQIVRGFSDHFSTAKEVPVQPKNHLFIAMGQNQRTILTNRLKMLLMDHKLTNKNCKHCILRYKKSSSIMNLFIGNVSNYFPDITSTTFANLNTTENMQTEDGVSGMAIGIDHSLTLKSVSHLKTLMYLPFLSITRDVGFFKDNIAVHCTESEPLGPKFTNDENSRVDQDHEAVLVKFIPTIRVDRSVIGQFDDNFWKYHRNLEKKIATRDEESTLEEKANSTNPRTSTKKHGTVIGNLGPQTGSPVLNKKIRSEYDFRQGNGQNLYVLLFRKEFLRKEILKEFEINAHSKSFSNSFIIRIKEIELKFNNLIGLCSVLNTLDNLSYLSNWFEAFYKKYSSMKKVDLMVTKNESQSNTVKGPMTHDQMINLLNRENISIMIDKFNLLINVKQPTNVVSFEVRKLMFENFPDKAFQSSIGANYDLSAIKIFAVEVVNFRTNAKALGSIEDLSLIYNPKAQNMNFTVRRIFHERPNKRGEYILKMPADDEFLNRFSTKKALNIQLQFFENVLSNITIFAAPISLFLSHNDVSEELSSLALFSNLFSKEKATMPQIIMGNVFEKELFEYFHNVVVKNNKLKELDEESKDFNPLLSFAIFAANPKMKLNLTCSKLVARCEKFGQEFAVLTTEGNELEIDVAMNYKMDFQRLSLVPSGTLYTEILTPVSKNHQLTVIFEKKENFPTLTIFHGKVLFLNRVIKELIEFRKELEEEIISSAKSLLTLDNAAFGEDLEHARRRLVNKDLDVEPMIQIKLYDCVVVIPRHSTSQDMVIIKVDQIVTKTNLRTMTMQMPIELKAPFDIVDHDQIMSEKEQYQSVQSAFFHTEGEAKGLQIFYNVADRNILIGGLKSAQVLVVNAEGDLYKDNWLFDLLTKIKFDDFNLMINMGSLDELKEIIKTNIHEQSLLFPLKIKLWEKVQLALKGTDLGVNINRYLVPVNYAEPIYLQRKIKPEPIRDPEVYAAHLENVLDDMLFNPKQ